MIIHDPLAATTQAANGAANGNEFAMPAATGIALSALNARVHASVREIPRDAWARLFGNCAASWDYAAASERMAALGFTFGAIGTYEGDTLIGAVPMFRLDYRLDQPLGPTFKAIGGWLDRHAPSWITMPVLGLGSPLSDQCEMGFMPGLDETRRRAVFSALLDAMLRHATTERIRVLVLKDLTDADQAWCAGDLAASSFSPIPSLPVATLDLAFASTDAYIASLLPKMRQDLRRKLRQSAAVRIEYRDTIEGLEDEIAALYAATHAHRKTSYDSFDDVPRDYFQQVMATAGGSARLQLMWVGVTLGGFNLFIVDRDRVIGKYLGLRYPLSREHNLYFVNWIEMVRYCIEHGHRTLHVGQSSYALKVRLGCKLHRSWVYCRHTGLVRGPLFRVLSQYAAFDRMDPDLRALGAEAPYADPDQRAA